MDLRWALIDSFVGNSSDACLTYDRPCPICGSSKSKAVMKMNKFQFFSDSVDRPKMVDIEQNMCSKCGSLFLNPCYSDVGFSILFEEAGQSYGASGGRHEEQAMWMSERGLFERDVVMLDVGCYDGKLLASMPPFLKRVGVDIDEIAVERGRDTFAGQGIEFILGDFGNFTYGGKFDIITMFHVLEHLSKPQVVLSNLRKYAHDNTHLVVEVPIIENGTTDDINGFFSVQHMTHFSRCSLSNILRKTGWRIVEWFEQQEYNGCRVLVKPTEVFAEIEIGVEETVLLYEYLSKWFAGLAEINRKFSKVRDSNRCIVWGGGLHTEFIYHMTSFFQSKGDREYLIVDSDISKQGKTWRGVPIYAPNVLAEMDVSRVPLVVSSYGNQEDISCNAADLGVPANQIIRLYDHIHVY